MIELFDDQMQLVNDGRAALAKGHKRILIQAATGFGKTVVAAYMIKSANQRGRKCAMQVPRKELLRQTKKTWQKFEIPHSQVAAGYFYAPDSTNHLLSMQTYIRRLDKIDPDIVFIDEAHFGAKTMDDIISYLTAKGKIIIGLSATPLLPNGEGMGKWFDAMVCSPSVRWLIDNKRLSDYRLFGAGQQDFTNMPMSNGEYSKKPMSERLEHDKALVGDVVAHYKKHAYGSRHATFCYSIKHSQMMNAQYNEAGIPSAHIDGDTPDADRKRIIRAYANNELLNLCSVDLMLFGFDLSAQVDMDVTIESMSDARPTQSLTSQMQKNGRVLRMKEKPALIFDHVGNHRIHGLPCADRDWSLNTKKRKRQTEQTAAAAIKTCDVCFFCHSPAPKCPNCGNIYPEPKGRELEQIDGELEEIKRIELQKAKRREEGMCHTLEDWLELAKERGYKRGWAIKRHELRSGK